MITKGQVERAVNSAESEYLECWSFLVAMKKGKLNEGKCMSLLQFQPRLAAVIFDLTRNFREIEQEKRHRIERKRTYSADWFAARMNFLSQQQKLLNEAISIGKGIGDAFALFFYRCDRHYLAEHLVQPAQPHTPPGIGGVGELEFVRHVNRVHGYFLLYHGTTSILRLGDLTLIDLESLRVAGIGELKSNAIDAGQIEITLLLSGPNIDQKKLLSDLAEPEPKEKPINIEEKLSRRGQDRLKRQMQRISTSYKKLQAKPDQRLNVEMDGHFEDFAEFVSRLKVGRFSYAKLGNSLLLVGCKATNKSLYKKLSSSGKATIGSKLVGIESHALDLMANDRDDNAIIVGALYYDSEGRTRHIPGMSHLVWWPINHDVIKSILFQEVIIFTIFNPVHFIASLERAGFSVEETSARNYKVSKKGDGYELVVEGMPYYLEMIQQYLICEEAIISLLNATEEQLAGLDRRGSAKIELLIEQRFGSMPI